MNLNQLLQGEPWMTPEEHTLNRQIIQDAAERLETQGVPETAFITLRVNDVAVTWLLARRLERALTPAEGEAPPCPTPAQAGAIGKCRERLRKAMKDLEACCPKTGAPAPKNFVDYYHELTKKVRATGLIDDGPFPCGSTVGMPEPLPEGPGAPVNPRPGSITPAETAPREIAPGKTAPSHQPQSTPSTPSTPSTSSTSSTPSTPSTPSASSTQSTPSTPSKHRPQPPEVVPTPDKTAIPHPPHDTG